MEPKEISYFVFMGDSLSERGTLALRLIFKLFPFYKLSGLNHSPLGRFTNGLVWTDHFSAQIASQFLVEELRKKNFKEDKRVAPSVAADLSDEILARRFYKRIKIKPPPDPFASSEISDGFIYEDLRTLEIVKDAYMLENALYIKYKGREYVRSYAEGGLSAHDYSRVFTFNPALFLKRILLSKLYQMRKNLLIYDKSHPLYAAYRSKTLIFEWSGANDLITVNTKPTFRAADLAIRERIANVEKLIQQDYRHFILFNLPDLSLTPRFQKKSISKRKNALDCTDYFNNELSNACINLQKMYPHCSVEVFDVNSLFRMVYENPEAYRLDKDKLTLAYVNSDEFKLKHEHASSAKGYMFWDSVHPSATVHALISFALMETYKDRYHFKAPAKEFIDDLLDISEEELCLAFKMKYQQTINQDRNGFFGALRRNNINLHNLNLESILEHALYKGDKRTCKVIKKLQWVDEVGNIKLNIPALIEAKGNIEARRAALDARSRLALQPN